MIKALNTAASGMQAQQTNMDVISNNIANVNTTGFKKSRAEFEDLLYQTVKEPGTASGNNSISPVGVQIGLGVKTAAVSKDFEPGSPRITKNALDLQVEGHGFFPVLLPNGQVAYTRDGSFKKDPTGRITDSNGNPLQPEIVVPPNASGIEISPTGKVDIAVGDSLTPQTVGQIQLVNFVNPAGLRALGRNLFMPSAASGLPIQGNPGENGMGTIAQGQLEASNVNIVDEMVNMITAQRAYETNSKAVQAVDQMLQSTNNLR
jgi:flagellar basal-body rod protein FlgG